MLYQLQSVHSNILNGLRFPVRPEHLGRDRRAVFSKPEVKREIVLKLIKALNGVAESGPKK